MRNDLLFESRVGKQRVVRVAAQDKVVVKRMCSEVLRLSADSAFRWLWRVITHRPISRLTNNLDWRRLIERPSETPPT